MDTTEQMVPKSQASEITGDTSRQIDRGVKAGTYPKPYYVSARKPLWVKSELLALIQKRIADRDAGVLPAHRQAIIDGHKRGGQNAAAARKRAAAPALRRAA